MHFKKKFVPLLFTAGCLLLCGLNSAQGAKGLRLRPAQVQDGNAVELKTSQGTIIIRLFKDKAPKTVENFLKYVSSKHYDGTIFHRVIVDFMIQGGGFTSSMAQKPTLPPIPNEASNGLANIRGTVAMARLPSPHSAQAQFFINLKNNSQLNHQNPQGQGWGYCVFGQVVQGMDVVDRIAKSPTGNKAGHGNVPIQPVKILSAWIRKL